MNRRLHCAVFCLTYAATVGGPALLSAQTTPSGSAASAMRLGQLVSFRADMDLIGREALRCEGNVRAVIVGGVTGVTVGFLLPKGRKWERRATPAVIRVLAPSQ